MGIDIRMLEVDARKLPFLEGFKIGESSIRKLFWKFTILTLTVIPVIPDWKRIITHEFFKSRGHFLETKKIRDILFDHTTIYVSLTWFFP